MEHIYMSGAPSDPVHKDTNLVSAMDTEAKDHLVDIATRARQGDHIARHEIPDVLWGRIDGYRAANFGASWPDFSSYANLWLISAPLAEILRQFDLGRGSIHSVELLEWDRETRVDGDWFLWNVGNRKSSLRIEESRALRPAGGPNRALLMAKDDDVAFGPEAALGPDAWFDERLAHQLLFSQSLGEALIANGFATRESGIGPLLRGRIVS